MPSTITTFAVEASVVHTGVNAAPQPGSHSVSPANVAGGVAMLVLLAVMITAGLSAAGIVRSSKSATAHADTAHTAH